MKYRGKLQVVILLGLCLSCWGCVTKKLWEEDPFARIHEPAVPLQLELFESKVTADVLVRYAEWTESNERRTTRAYWLNANLAPRTHRQRPRFASTAAVEGLAQIPIFPELPATAPVNEALFAVAITNPPGFDLYAANRQLATYSLPVYHDAQGRTMQVILTPPAVVADVIIGGAVVAGYCGLLWWAGGGP